jgi:hypothetical protein
MKAYRFYCPECEKEFVSNLKSKIIRCLGCNFNLGEFPSKDKWGYCHNCFLLFSIKNGKVCPLCDTKILDGNCCIKCGMLFLEGHNLNEPCPYCKKKVSDIILEDLKPPLFENSKVQKKEVFPSKKEVIKEDDSVKKGNVYSKKIVDKKSKITNGKILKKINAKIARAINLFFQILAKIIDDYLKSIQKANLFKKIIYIFMFLYTLLIISSCITRIISDLSRASLDSNKNKAENVKIVSPLKYERFLYKKRFSKNEPEKKNEEKVIIQVGSFQNKENADKLSKELEKIYHRVYTKDFLKGSQIFSRVLIGPLSESEAFYILDEIKMKYGKKIKGDPIILYE